MVHCGEWVHGTPKSFSDLFRLKVKVCDAKSLLNWMLLWEKLGIKKSEVMRITWPDNSMQRILHGLFC